MLQGLVYDLLGGILECDARHGCIPYCFASVVFHVHFSLVVLSDVPPLKAKQSASEHVAVRGE